MTKESLKHLAIENVFLAIISQQGWGQLCGVGILR